MQCLTKRLEVLTVALLVFGSWRPIRPATTLCCYSAPMPPVMYLAWQYRPPRIERPLQPGAPVLSVVDFGAAGDGRTDDTIAIQAAINAIPATGGTVLLPKPGAYLLSRTLTVVGQSQLTIECDPGTLIIAADSTFDMLTTDRNSPYFTTLGCVWQGVSVGEETRAAIRIYAPYANVHDSVFTRINAGVSIQDGGAWYGRIIDNWFIGIQGVTSGNGYATVTIGKYTIISRNHFINTGRHDVYIAGNYASHGGGANYSTVSDNESDGNLTAAISLYATATEAQLDHVSVHNNVVRNCANGIILTQQVSESQIHDNKFYNCSKTAIWLNGSTAANTFPTKNVVSLNLIDNCGPGTDSITVSNSIANVVALNTIQNGHTGVGIRIAGAPAADPINNVVRNNKIFDTTTAVFMNAPLLATTLVSGNVIAPNP